MANKIQLRGSKLLDAIEYSLKKLFKEKENYIYNASELSRTVGCSRPTLDSKTKFIEKILEEIGVIKRIKFEHPLIEQMSNKIQLLEIEKISLLEKLDVLKRHHVNIYTNLYRESIDAALLIQPILESEIKCAKECLLCGQEVKTNHEFPIQNKIIPFSKK